MKIAVAGTGYVGLVTGVCMAEKGHDVTCVDVSEEKINLLSRGIPVIYEHGLEDLMIKNSARLSYTTDYKSAYKDADVIFIGVGTPEKKDGSANLNHVYAVARQIAESVENSCVIVVKSTVPVGSNDKVEKILNENKKHKVRLEVVSNPEFLSQGSAVRDTLEASRIVVGVESKNAEKIMRELYKGYDAPLVVTDRRSAEMIKYASNDFLALKISYINEIANLCEIVGANVEDVAKGMGLDSRIGDKFLNAGIGYGGSCFPKDTKALHWLATMNDYEIKTIKAAIEVNELQKLKLIDKARKHFESFEGLTIAVLGLTFKPGTDDLREAASLVNIPIFLEDGATVKAFDPVGADNFRREMLRSGIEGAERIEYCSDIDSAIKDADACFILTEWEAVRNYDASKFSKLMNRAMVFDGRNCFRVDAMKQAGVVYESIGRS